MPKKYRLSRADFTHSRGFKRLNGTFFTVSYGTIPGRSTRGGACVVSSKVAPTAVARNRIKRRARVALVSLLEEVQLVVICHAKKGAEKASSLEIQGEILGLSTKISVR